WGWPASSTIRVARICTGRARLEQTELKKRKGGWWTAHHHPARGVCRQTEGGSIIAPPFGVVLTGNTRPPTNPRPGGGPTREADGADLQLPTSRFGGMPTREDDRYAIILKPGHTKRGTAYPGNNHTPGKAGPHSCSISETASANTACSTASPKRPSPKRQTCTPTPSKSSSRAAPRAWTPSTASPAPLTQPPAEDRKSTRLNSS